MDELSGLEGASPQQRLQSVGTAVGLTVGGFLVAVVIAVLGIALLSRAGIPVREQQGLLLGAGILLQNFGFFVAGVLYMRYTGNWGLVSVRWPSLRDLGVVLGGMVALLVGLAVFTQLLNALGIEGAQNAIVDQARGDPELVLLLIPLQFIAVGPGEEFLFRGIVQGVLGKAYAAIPAVVIASALFAVAHVFALSGSAGSTAATIGVIFALGAILGWTYEMTGNLVVNSVIHGLFNAVQFAVLYVSITGGI